MKDVSIIMKENEHLQRINKKIKIHRDRNNSRSKKHKHNKYFLPTVNTLEGVSMTNFTEKVQPLSLAPLELELIDLLTMRLSEQKIIKEEFNAKFGDVFLAKNFPGEKLCTNGEELNVLLDHYVDESRKLRANKQPTQTLEDWSINNADLYILDFNTAPNEGVRWFEIQDLISHKRVGAIQISQINATSNIKKQFFVSAHAIMTLPTHRVWSYGNYWGEVLRRLLDEPFIHIDDPTISTSIEEWTLPTDPRGRYVDRPGLSFGKDIIDHAVVDRIVEKEGPEKEFAPRNLRKRLREM